MGITGECDLKIPNAMQNKGCILEISCLSHKYALHPARRLCPLFLLGIPLTIPPVAVLQERLLSHLVVFDSALQTHISTFGIKSCAFSRNKKRNRKASTTMIWTLSYLLWTFLKASPSTQNHDWGENRKTTKTRVVSHNDTEQQSWNDGPIDSLFNHHQKINGQRWHCHFITSKIPNINWFQLLKGSYFLGI